jgi:outer membrane biosynthesis protein TonB
VALVVAGCAHRPPAPVPTTVDAPPALGVAEARASCPNYERVMSGFTYPNDAIVRGIDGGRATVRFDVSGSQVRVLSVTSSDPAFGAAAFELVRKLECRTDRPTTFEIPLTWQTSR